MMQWIWEIGRFYGEGFRSMTLGKTLWLIVLIKLFLFFVVLRLFFFPDFLNSRCRTADEKAKFVGNELVNYELRN